jgi:TonB family protein
MNAASAEPHPAGLAGKPPAAPEIPPGPEPPGVGSWTRSRWLMLIVLVFAAHVALLYVFGGRKQIVPRAVTNVPVLKLARQSSELLALNDPTLFALPHSGDFEEAIRMPTSVLKQPLFRWTEPSGELALSAQELGTVFNEFMQTNRFAEFELQLKPPFKLSPVELPAKPLPAQNSTWRIEGELAKRQLPSQINLTNWPYADVLPPSVVQAVVDAAGKVVSTVLLSPSGYDAADQRALEIARALRFAPSSHLTVGRMVFNWRTVPPPATNAPANP